MMTVASWITTQAAKKEIQKKTLMIKNDDDEFIAWRSVEIFSRRNVVNFNVDDQDIRQQIVLDIIL
jgi:hypothetical protein